MIDSKKGFLFLSLLFVLTGYGCFPSYNTQTGEYKNFFQPSDSIPDYSNFKFWAAHPWKKDPSDSIPLSLRKIPIDTSVDVFFIHPTSFTDPHLNDLVWNASLSDADLNAKTDYTSILYQASVFNGSCRVFAPRYRQAHYFSFLTKDTLKSKAALSLAYKDVEAAFLYYLKNYNNGRPLIIASHSQGTLHAALLLKEYFENTPLQQQLVAAYIVGLPVSETYFSLLEPCATPTQTGCINSWRTLRTGYMPDYVQQEKTKAIVTNPLSWIKTDSLISRKKNEGSVLYNFNRKYKYTNSAKIEGNILWTNRPRIFFSFLLKTKNYHAGDYNLFYYSIRENLKQRIAAFTLKEKSMQ
ncbi:DUF3089 domain-containing protein [Lacibacter luteus]|uniref:DUF3089 domain-containing protein n=1 Tax=Lacibacter luteus TaxID=2508719 RepID=UPI0013E93449|nr:DUF3089 domain-containing protein [Lacibacter luteus]